MKKEHKYLIIGILASTLVWWFFSKKKENKDYKQAIRKQDNIVFKECEKIKKINKYLIIDSVSYEKEKKAIHKLRNSIPNDVLLDSLFRAANK